MPFVKKNEKELAWDWVDDCHEPEHFPPSMISMPAGVYEWTCPKCGKATTVHFGKRGFL